VTTTDYRPIGCDAHSALEVLAMRRTEAVVGFVDAQARPGRLEGRVVDVFTRAGAEYLRVLCRDGSGVEIRLDRLHVITSPAGEEMWCQ
jgi:transcriptional antiterminator Rof (Rho-off)